ncbi:ATP-dependent RNA helicase DDX50-like [Diadema antillarum]|uniref:ATP-dependent RNA helicase DDX50-like n=1 Tax=Diadema antillarum TaxID=105358 RepID=UPI003A8BD9D1
MDETDRTDIPCDDDLRKKKKSKKNRKGKPEDEKPSQNGKISSAEEDEKPSASSASADKKKKKKRKQDSSEEDGDVTSKKKVKTEGSSACSTEKEKRTTSENMDVDVDSAERQGAFSKFDIGPKTIERLKAKGINFLFPIQANTFIPISEGFDVIGQARTGTGKTLSFVLPLVEKLQQIPQKSGRPPVVLALAPTRELAKQISEYFEFISPHLSTACIYGGTAYWPQESAIRRGLDVVVGTPGRILDYIRKKTLDLSKLRHVILDEVDRMLDMGFAEEVEEILSAAYNTGWCELRELITTNPQTLLFSATVPPWVYQTAMKYMSKDLKKVDLVGRERVRTATTVEHLAINCSYFDRPEVISDVIKVYGGLDGRCMVFCETKKDANELAMSSAMKQETQVMHGDIPQTQREVTLKGFREGKFQCLVTTDVAARGLDIPEVDLVIQCNPPKDVDSYIHRSGRTGRAGRNGVCVCFYKRAEERDLQKVEYKAGIKFKRVAAPQPSDIIKSSVKDVTGFLNEVSLDMVALFRDAAREIIAEKGAEEALAAALAHISGSKAMKTRSLLTAEEGKTTLFLETQSHLFDVGDVFRTLGRYLDRETRSAIKGIRICVDQTSAVFDVVNDHKDHLLSLWRDTPEAQLTVAAELPELIIAASDSFDDRRGGGGGFRGRGGGGFRRFGDRRGGGGVGRGGGGGGWGSRNGGDRRRGSGGGGGGGWGRGGRSRGGGGGGWYNR